MGIKSKKDKEKNSKKEAPYTIVGDGIAELDISSLRSNSAFRAQLDMIRQQVSDGVLVIETEKNGV
ncbi:MAG: hypothetical protein VXY23_03770 [Pseudomonadota bacterium]|nr:hypothetical protein [Pseudomonadota bacterium]